MTARRAAPFLAFLAVFPLVATVAPAVLAVDVTFGRPSATATWGDAITFVQPAQLGGGLKRVEILLETPGALGPQVVEVALPPGGDSVALRYALLMTEDHLPPHTTITARWRVTGQDGSTAVSPPATVRYEDTRFEWRTVEGATVRVHWYEGSDAFGQRVLRIGETAVRETSERLGVTEDEPIDFFVYGNAAEFREALGPATGEFVIGQAHAAQRTMFALIPPDQVNAELVETVVPHELVHLVFATAVDNPYHFPPSWLNEGLAVYLSSGYTVGDRLLVEGAARDGTLIPLRGLADFPSGERAFLAYAEGAAAIDYLIRTHGQDTLVSLIRSYEDGKTDDEAFQAAIGMDVDAFDAAWRAELDAKEPTAFGPQPAPAGPVPPGWTDAEGSTAPSLPPAAPGDGPGPGPDSPGRGVLDRPFGALLVGIALVALSAIALILVSGRRRRRLPPPVE